MEVHLLHPKDVPSVWEEVQPLIDKALIKSDETHNSSDYLDLILDGVCTLCVGLHNNEIQMSLVLEVVEVPRTKVLEIHIWATKSGYDFQPWIDQFDCIEKFGRDNGCTLIEATVRKGLAKKLKWDNNYSLLTKHI